MPHQFIASPFHNKTSGREIDLVVIHTIENDEKPEGAENCARWFQDPRAKCSAHYTVDNNSIVQCVREEDVAWHAPGANHNGIGIEHTGRARQSRAEWEDAFSRALLERSAELTADLCRRYKIPITWLHPADLRAGRRGITSHGNVSLAFRRSDHTDPGKGFPIEKYLALVRKKMKADGGAPVAEAKPVQGPPPLVRRGDRGWQVKRLQRLLDARGFDAGDADGIFGAQTERAVRELQVAEGLEPDGIAGPLTWKALLAGEREPARVGG